MYDRKGPAGAYRLPGLFAIKCQGPANAPKGLRRALCQALYLCDIREEARLSLLFGLLPRCLCEEHHGQELGEAQVQGRPTAIDCLMGSKAPFSPDSVSELRKAANCGLRLRTISVRLSVLCLQEPS